VLYKWVLQAIAKLLRHSPKKIGFPSENMLLKINAKLKCISETPHYQIHNMEHGKLKYISDPLPLSMLLLVRLNVITKSITELRMSEMTMNV